MMIGLLMRLAGLTTALALFAGCNWHPLERFNRPQPPPVAYQIEPWNFGRYAGSKVTTGHYVLYTTVQDPDLVRSFPGLVERGYAYYQTLVPPAREPAAPMVVYLFATRSQWAYATEKITGSRSRVYLQIRNGGYSDNGISVIQYVTHPVTFPLLAHEGFHQYLHHCVNPQVPAWINEGLAVVCEGQRWTGSGLEEFDPWYNPLRQNQLANALLRDRLYPVGELLDMHAGSVVHETSVRIGTYYAQVWALSLFLREGAEGKYAAGFERLRRSLAAPDLAQRVRTESIFTEAGRISPGQALFRSFITDDLEGFEAEYRTFLRQRLLSEPLASSAP